MLYLHSKTHFMQMVQFFFFFSKQRNTHFFYMLIYKRSLFSLYIYIYIYYIIYKSVNFFLRFSRAGTVHTPGTEACHTCIAFCILQLVGWQAWCHPGSAAVGEFTNTHTPPLTLFFASASTPRQPHIILIPWHQPIQLVASHCLDDIRVGAGSKGWPSKLQME